MMMAQLLSRLRCGSVMSSSWAMKYSTAHSVKVNEIRLLLVRKRTSSEHSGQGLIRRERSTTSDRRPAAQEAALESQDYIEESATQLLLETDPAER